MSELPSMTHKNSRRLWFLLLVIAAAPCIICGGWVFLTAPIRETRILREVPMPSDARIVTDGRNLDFEAFTLLDGNPVKHTVYYSNHSWTELHNRYLTGLREQ